MVRVIIASLMLTWAADVTAQDEPPPAAVEDEPIDLSEPPPPPPPPIEADEPTYPERRCGFALGVSLGPLIGSARGYPNDALKIDRDEFLTETGAGFGGQLGIYIGIALADWFVLGLGPTFGNIMSADDVVTGAGSGGFHIDAFPLFGLGGAWQDVSVMVEAGVGVLETVNDKMPDDKLIDSGTGSRLALGLSWEGIQAWKLSMGPFVTADMMWSPSSFRPAGWLGWRTTFYGGP